MSSFILPLVFLLVLLEPFIRYAWDSKKLRRFPNATPSSGIFNLSYILLRWRGFRSRDLHEIHKENPVLRTGPNSVSFSSPAAIRAIYGHSTPCIKGGTYDRTLSDHPGLIEVVDKQQHAAKRRILSNAFASRNLEQWEFKVADKVSRFLHQFDRIATGVGGDAVVDFRRWVNLFSVDAIVDIALSQKLGCLDRGDDSIPIVTRDGNLKEVHFIQALHWARRPTSLLVYSDWFHPLKFILEKVPGFFRSQWKLGQGFTELVQHLVRQRVQRYHDGEELDDLTTCLLQDKAGQERKLSISEIEGDVSTLLDAGSDTTAIALTHVMYCLLKTPSALSRLREEVDTHVADTGDGVVTYSSIKNLPYLHACLDESLRLFPPVSTGLHRVTPPQGLTIDNHKFAGNTVVSVPIYTAHRNPQYFPNPESFEPDRWLHSDSKELQSSFMPFSAGARGCIGRNITYIEQAISLASLVRRYHFELPSPEWELEHEEAFNLWPGPMPLSVSIRDRAGEE